MKIARKLRSWFPGAVYHIMHRGVRRKAIFQEEMDYQVFLQVLKTSLPGLSERQRRSIFQNHSLEKPKRILEDCQNNNISILCWNNRRYPARAKKPTDAPIVLYYKGNFKNMDQTVGIVGARRCGQESKQRTIALASEYAQKQVTVVSGM